MHTYTHHDVTSQQSTLFSDQATSDAWSIRLVVWRRVSCMTSQWFSTWESMRLCIMCRKKFGRSPPTRKSRLTHIQPRSSLKHVQALQTLYWGILYSNQTWDCELYPLSTLHRFLSPSLCIYIYIYLYIFIYIQYA